MDEGPISRFLHRVKNGVNPFFHFSFPVAAALENSRQPDFEIRFAGFDDFDFHSGPFDPLCLLISAHRGSLLSESVANPNCSML
jgi:hypothetical protein